MSGFGVAGGGIAGSSNFGATSGQQSGFGFNAGGFGVSNTTTASGMGKLETTAVPFAQAPQASGAQGGFGHAVFGAASTAGGVAPGGFGSAAKHCGSGWWVWLCSDHSSSSWWVWICSEHCVSSWWFGSAANTAAPAGGFGSAANTAAPAGGFGSAANTAAPAGGFGS
ncbi:hypothetical protein TraAM80_06824, partial [Trypanosoma rangeli]